MPRRRTIHLNPMFQPGEEIHEIWWNDDIGAWDCSFWTPDTVHVILEKNQRPSYGYMGKDGILVREDQADFFKTSLEAAQEARRRNEERITR